jgi:perosamine synthetase
MTDISRDMDSTFSTIFTALADSSAQPRKIAQVSPWLGDAEADAVAAVLRDGWITEGRRAQAFSEKLNHLIGVPYGVFAPNGTLALALGLMAIGVGPGDEVLVPDTTFIGSATAVLMVGAVPVFVDVDDQTFQIDMSRAGAHLSSRTRAIMPVHLFGTACDMTSVLAFAQTHGLLVIEDAAQGIGVTFGNRHVGSLGDVGCFSFFADKTITTGEGGYVVCKDPAVFERLRLLRNQGRLDRGSYIHESVGYNFRVTDLQCAIGLVQLARLDRVISRKAELLRRYQAGLAHVPDVRVLGAAPNAGHVPFRCVLMARDVRGLMAHLEAAGVETRSFFHPLHRQPGLSTWRAARTDAAPLDDDAFPNANYGWDHGVCLPIRPTLSTAEVDVICEAIADFYGV